MNPIMMKQKLGFFEILKEALNLIFNNTTFILFTFLSSLPLFCFSLHYEPLLQATLLRISEFIWKQHPGNFNYDWQTLLHTTSRMAQMFSHDLIHLGALYLVPYHLLELCTVYVTVDLGSKMHHVEGKSTLKAKFRGALVTSIWVLFLSSCALLGTTWLVSIYYVIMRNLGSKFSQCFGVLYRAASVGLVAKYLEWSSIWNMGIVVSILENAKGANALMLSAHLSRGNERQGLLIALVFGVLGLGVRCSCLYFKCYERRHRIFAQIGISCLANVVKWVVYMVYFCNCKNRILKMKVDEEMGKDERCVIKE